MSTLQNYIGVIENCKDTFIKKTADYGTSWRVYRSISVADQIYIKARRIRNIQEGIIPKIDDDIPSEFSGIINYCIIGLIQLNINNEEPEDLPVAEVVKQYELIAKQAKELMLAKNNDYGEAWRDMSQEGKTDLILAKILRIKQILKNEGKTSVSEGIDANFYDILNYAVFALILNDEKTS
jgi:hypothetical protein